MNKCFLLILVTFLHSTQALAMQETNYFNFLRRWTFGLPEAIGVSSLYLGVNYYKQLSKVTDDEKRLQEMQYYAGDMLQVEEDQKKRAELGVPPRQSKLNPQTLISRMRTCAKGLKSLNRNDKDLIKQDIKKFKQFSTQQGRSLMLAPTQVTGNLMGLTGPQMIAPDQLKAQAEALHQTLSEVRTQNEDKFKDAHRKKKLMHKVAVSATIIGGAAWLYTKLNK